MTTHTPAPGTNWTALLLSGVAGSFIAVLGSLGIALLIFRKTRKSDAEKRSDEHRQFKTRQQDEAVEKFVIALAELARHLGAVDPLLVGLTYLRMERFFYTRPDTVRHPSAGTSRCG